MEVQTNAENHNEGIEFEPLFEKGVSEDDLKGTTEGDAADSAPEGDQKDEAQPGEDAEKKAEEAGKTEEEKAEAEKAEQERVAQEKAEADKKADVEKPPPGYVPTAALHQEREKLRNVKAAMSNEIQTLRAENEKLKHGTDDFKDFKVLSEQEFEDLLLDDPDGATRYTNKLVKYQEHVLRKQSEQQTQQRLKDEEASIVTEGIEAIDQVLPGIIEGKNESAKAIVDFAKANGIEEHVLNVFTSPATKVITPDGVTALLGNAAAQVVALLKNAYELSIKNPPEAELRQTIEAELRPKIQAEEQEKLIKKLQTDPASFRSLDSVPGSGKDNALQHGGVYTEAEWAKLSDQERAALLGA